MSDDELELDPRLYFSGPANYTIRVELMDVEPTIWRRIVVSEATKLPKFNRILLAAMGWAGHHLHSFELGDVQFGAPDDELDYMIDERKITLTQILPRPGSQLAWVYDFGDYWQHGMVVESIDAPKEGAPAAAVLDGAGACPPDDCGGVAGYEHLLDVLADQRHEEYEGLIEWLGGEFDPEAFDLEEVNKRVGRVR